MSKIVERLEDMSPKGRLRVCVQGDGDVIICLIQDDGRMADVEFCTPGAGGGGSRRTWEALRNLVSAMEADNDDPRCSHRAQVSESEHG